MFAKQGLHKVFAHCFIFRQSHALFLYQVTLLWSLPAWLMPREQCQTMIKLNIGVQRSVSRCLTRREVEEEEAVEVEVEDEEEEREEDGVEVETDLLHILPEEADIQGMSSSCFSFSELSFKHIYFITKRVCNR